MIDVIIPAYNAHDTIEETLQSLALQVAKDFMTVTVVNDNGDDYADIIKRFKGRLNVKELHKRVNGGAGLARQYGIDNTSNPYIVFVDADDILPDVFTIHQQFNLMMREQDCVMACGDFLEETPDGQFVGKSQDTTWLHGKMYRRSHIQKHHIHFSDLRLCEDVEFNMRVKLHTSGNEHVRFMTDKYYYIWRNNRKSITRKDVDKLPYCDIAIAGSVASYRALKDDIYENVKYRRGEIMSKVMEMFNYYNLLAVDKPDKPEWLQEVMAEFGRFWRDVAKPIYQEAPKAEVARMFLNRDKGNVEHIIPVVTFDEFIKLLNTQDNERHA